MSHKKEMSEVKLSPVDQRLKKFHDAQVESVLLLKKMFYFADNFDGSATDAVLNDKELAMQCLKCLWTLAYEYEHPTPILRDGAQL